MTSIEYISKKIKNSIINDIRDVAHYHSRVRNKKSAGHFSVPRSIFSFIDHLGYIAFGDDSSTRRAIKFIKDFFPKKYTDYAELIYAMWRHGVIHQYFPISYKTNLNDGSSKTINVKWVSTIHNRKKERQLNLLAFPMEGNEDSVYIVINNCQFVDDLLIALDNLLEKLRLNKQFENECTNRIKNLLVVEDYKQAKGISKDVKNQIIKTWNNKDGLLDNKANMVKGHSESKK